MLKDLDLDMLHGVVVVRNWSGANRAWHCGGDRAPPDVQHHEQSSSGGLLPHPLPKALQSCQVPVLGIASVSVPPCFQAALVQMAMIP